MTSKQIAMDFIGRKIKEPTQIFNDIDIFKSILLWCRDAAREYFATQATKRFLIDYIDDVAQIVDKYMIDRVSKMYKKAIKNRNKLFENLCSPQKTIGWLIDRWINVFINLTTNKNYRAYIDIKNLNTNFCDNDYSFLDNKIEVELEFEKAKKLPKFEKIKLLKEVWEEARYDDFDEYDMLYLVEKLDLKLDEVFENKGDLEKLNLKKEQVGNCHSQLVIIF
ncbi:hypothetical protein [Arcobacter porcinus]|uniref:Uncharacterized protein n=1 Tax=Arcobacter porcinus TaxID=1935204 RepID=A0A5C2HGL0_9BACT|nr:hypothetical protein [Arcobacter porcinus]OCL89404.1 hypothetical protein AAX27_01935 [Aliarcobacter thereius]QEP40451.1 hypothetical protein APORC_0843 [Arcobacter porcinus]